MPHFSYAAIAFAAAGAALLIASTATYLGYALLSHWPLIPAPTRMERWVFGAGLGFGVMSTCMYVLGAAALWTTGAVWVLLGALIIFSIAIIRKPAASPRLGEKEFISSTFDRIGGLCLGFFFLIFFFFNLTPEIFYDALFYHLSVPDLYRQAGRLFDIPTLFFSNFVQTIQMLYGLGLTLGTAVTAKWLHALFGVMMLGAYLSLGCRYFRSRTGLFAALLFFSLPATGLSILTSTADLGWSAFEFLGAYALLVALCEESSGWLLLAGTLTGIAAGCKTTGLAYVPAFACLVFWQKGFEEGRSWSDAFADTARFILPACLMLTPLWIRNMAYHGNPIFPFGAMFFGGESIDPERWRLFLSDAGTPQLSSILKQPFALFAYLVHPWFRLLRNHLAFYLSPLLLFFIPFIFTQPAPSKAETCLRRMFVAAWLIWILSNPTPRYGLPVLALLTPLALHATFTHPAFKRVKTVLLSVWLAATTVNALLLVRLSVAAEGWKVLFGQISESAYLSRTHPIYPNPPYPAIAWMNNHLPETAHVLFIGEARTYGMRRATTPVGVIDPQPLSAWSRTEPDAAALRARLRAAGITHLFINVEEAKRTAHYGTMRWTPEAWSRFQTFWTESVQLLWSHVDTNDINPQALYVYEILGEDEARKHHAAPDNPLTSWANP